MGEIERDLREMYTRESLPAPSKQKTEAMSLRRLAEQLTNKNILHTMKIVNFKLFKPHVLMKEKQSVREVSTHWTNLLTSPNQYHIHLLYCDCDIRFRILEARERLLVLKEK